MKNHPNQKLTDEDVEQIRQLIDWKKQEIARINSIASAAALAEKFDVSKRTIESIGNYECRRIRSPGLSYIPEKSAQTKKNISSAKIAQDLSAAGNYTRRTGVQAIEAIRELARQMTKTEVSKAIGWKDGSCIDGWLKARGYQVEFKRHIPVPPKRKGWGSIDLSRAIHG